MPHWKLTLAYNGSGFHGWQIQPHLPTIQGTLADALHHITGETVLPQGAGRTDTGVHALAQVASFSLTAPIPPANLQRALNRILPPGIRVLSAEILPATFHARHSARGKRYEYRLFERRSPTAQAHPEEHICSPFLAPFVWDCRWPLNLESMQTAAKHILGTHDFSAMAATTRPDATHDLSTPPSPRPPERSAKREVETSLYCVRSAETARVIGQRPASITQPNPIKTIHAATWTRLQTPESNLLLFQIQGSGFLHHMVRNLVGTMVDIGRGSLSADDLPRILASRDRSQAGPTAAASGLFLVEVLYLPSPEQPRASHTEDPK